jgi:hypothetical protein
MVVYGLGCMYGDENVCSDFIKKDLACIGWEPAEKPYIYGIIRDINIGDILVLKSFFQRKGNQVLRIKAFGFVLNNIIEEDIKLGHCLKVKWISYKPEGIEDFEFPNEEFDGGVQRRSTIYREYNLEVCKKIINLIVKRI